MLSIIELRSRHSKNASRACQQWARAFRLGASKAPSVEGLGLGLSIVLLTAAGLEAARRPICLCVFSFCFAQGANDEAWLEGVEGAKAIKAD